MSKTSADFVLDDGFEEKIIKLQASLYRIFAERADARRAGDTQLHDEAGARLVETDQEIRSQMRSEALQFAAEGRPSGAVDGDREVDELLRAFVRGVRLARIWRDIIMRPKISQYRGRKLIQSIYAELKRREQLGALKVLFDHPDISVRARAAAWALPIIPEECVAVLRDVKTKSHLTQDAGVAAFWALVVWERDHPNPPTSDAQTLEKPAQPPGV